MPARYSDVIRADSPSLYWRLGEGAQGWDSLSGIPIRDASGNGRNGTVANTVYSLPGALWGAQQPDFNGSALIQADGWITSSYIPFLQNSQRTYECWMYRFDWGTNPETVFGSDGSGDPALLRFDASTDTLKWHSQAGGGYVEWTVPVRYGWSHLVLRVDKPNNRVGLTVDGRLLGWQTYSTDYQVDPGNFVLGAWSNMYFDPFYGALDEFAIYEKLLTDEQIQAHYGAGRPRQLVFNGQMDGPASGFTDANSYWIAGWEKDVPGGSTVHTFAQSQEWAAEGSNSVLLDVTAPGTGGPHWPNIRSLQFRAQPGHWYVAQAVVNVTRATTSGQIWLSFNWWDGTPTWLSNDDGPMGGAGTGVKALTVAARAPATACIGRLSVRATTPDGERVAFHLDDVRLANASQDADAAAKTVARMRLA